MGLVLAHHLDVALFTQAEGRSGILFPGGIVGVDIFFALSGFLITTLLIQQIDDTGTVKLGAWWRDRAYRLLPALGVATIAVVVGLVVLGITPLGQALFDATIVMLYGTNWAAAFGYHVVSPLGHTWSLAIEVQFYLIWPLLLILAARRHVSQRTVLAIVACAIPAVWIWRAVVWTQVGIFDQVFPRTDLRADSLLLGALVSLAWRQGLLTPRRLRWLAVPALAILLTATFVMDLHNPSTYYVGYTLVGLSAATLVLTLLDPDWWLARLLARRPMVYLGDISYSLYLWHVPVIFVVAILLPGWLGVVLSIVGSLLAAALSRRFVELPFLRLKSRNHPRRPEPLDRVVTGGRAAGARDPLGENPLGSRGNIDPVAP